MGEKYPTRWLHTITASSYERFDEQLQVFAREHNILSLQIVENDLGQHKAYILYKRL